MKVYRVFTNEVCNSMYPEACIRSVVVMANNEDEAKEIADKNDEFTCDKDKREIEIVCESIETPTVIAVEYYNSNF